MPQIDSKALMRKALGVFLLLVTVGLATCQSVVNSFADQPDPTPISAPVVRSL